MTMAEQGNGKLKEEIKNVTIQSIRNFTKVHPRVFDKSFTESLAKRVAGQIYSYLLSKGIVDFESFIESLEQIEEGR